MARRSNDPELSGAIALITIVLVTVALVALASWATMIAVGALAGIFGFSTISFGEAVVVWIVLRLVVLLFSGK